MDGSGRERARRRAGRRWLWVALVALVAPVAAVAVGAGGRGTGGAETADAPPASVSARAESAPIRALRGSVPTSSSTTVTAVDAASATAEPPTSTPVSDASPAPAPISAGPAAPTTLAPVPSSPTTAPVPAAPLEAPGPVPGSSAAWTRRTDLEERLLRLHNEVRAQHGAGRLGLDDCHRSVAVRWARGMADRTTLQHNPSYAAQIGPCSTDTFFGENVGVGYVESGGVDGIFDAFMASADHWPNVLDPRFERVGIGAWSSDDGTIWVAVDFGAPHP